MNKPRRIYTLITPEGKEFIVGTYVSDATATVAIRRYWPSDWLRFCCYPLAQRIVDDDERFKRGTPWTGKE